MLARALPASGVLALQLSCNASSVELLYESNVHELDRMFGAVVRAIGSRGLRDQSLIAFTADHGEDLYRDFALLVIGHSACVSDPRPSREGMSNPSWVPLARAISTCGGAKRPFRRLAKGHRDPRLGSHQGAGTGEPCGTIWGRKGRPLRRDLCSWGGCYGLS